MTTAELQRIEKELGLSLPPEYREAVLNYDFPQDIEDELYDDPDVVIEDNLNFRSIGFSGLEWPAHFFAFGCDKDGSCYYLDLSASPPPVYFVDHETGVSELEIDTLAEWLEYAKEAQVDFEAEQAEEEAEATAAADAAVAQKNAAAASQHEYAQITNSKAWWQFWK